LFSIIIGKYTRKQVASAKGSNQKEKRKVIQIKRYSGLVKQGVALRDKNLRTQINGKFNDISRYDENK
jgi:hypothetical protein